MKKYLLNDNYGPGTLFSSPPRLKKNKHSFLNLTIWLGRQMYIHVIGTITEFSEKYQGILKGLLIIIYFYI